ncbi:uncharacterized protein Eint_070360 [Encephalitozoon intestinalis ATCC 50506]|uniref:Uncharacterized protein n=1 Tax=Encephalitozoon intestinalis (strain ATCC 50506) TaxID=876142 RepID=E0S7W5_ENCIT|nr:uncharacterized protein Eint_070360 [Encephalitozoon intestinalis ATCC 50506]ADM11800.1 hypothetical protein Eint_070360 [Encephalitozoon intestinalis ATCC 50506]UTX45549.1 hypothetical protein GPK93_07g11120 [Encephalitozoon intestinalis]
MVFCMENFWSIVPCRSKREEKVIKSTYLKSYEATQSECESDFFSDSGGLDEARGKDNSRRMKRNERNISKKIRKTSSSMVSEPRIDEKKKQKPRTNSTVSSEELWSGEDEEIVDQTESFSGFKERKRDRNRRGKSEGNREVSSEDSHFEDIQGPRRSSRTIDASAKKTEILEKYRSRIYRDNKKSRDPEDISRESGIESNDYGKEERFSKSQGLNRFGDSKVNERDARNFDDSESEINFIMDVYDKSSLNNSLREKMFEYLNQIGRKG